MHTKKYICILILSMFFSCSTYAATTENLLEVVFSDVLKTSDNAYYLEGYSAFSKQLNTIETICSKRKNYKSYRTCRESQIKKIISSIEKPTAKKKNPIVSWMNSIPITNRESIKKQLLTTRKQLLQSVTTEKGFNTYRKLVLQKSASLHNLCSDPETYRATIHTFLSGEDRSSDETLCTTPGSIMRIEQRKKRLFVYVYYAPGGSSTEFRYILYTWNKKWVPLTLGYFTKSADVWQRLDEFASVCETNSDGTDTCRGIIETKHDEKRLFGYELLEDGVREVTDRMNGVFVGR